MTRTNRATATNSTIQPKSRITEQPTTRNLNNHLSLVEPSEHRKVEFPAERRGGRPKNEDVRVREYLTEQEVSRLQEAAKKNRHGFRDSLMIQLMFRHGLRVSELVDMQWSQVDFENARVYIKRVKGSESGVHPIQGDELRQLRKLFRESAGKSPWLFVSNRKTPITKSSVQKMVEKAGKDAGLGNYVHAHQLRHACGYYMANKYSDTRLIQDWLGHRNIQNTVVYTKLSAKKFECVSFG